MEALLVVSLVKIISTWYELHRDVLQVENQRGTQRQQFERRRKNMLATPSRLVAVRFKYIANAAKATKIK
jgi:hypothetical protein